MVKRNNIVRALLFGIIMSLVGAVVFGILLYNQIILDWKWVSLAAILLAGAFFLIPIKKPKIYHVLIAVVWCAIWYFVFNFVAILMCETFIKLQLSDLTFRKSFLKVLELWRSNYKTRLIFESNLKTLMWCTINGSVVNFALVSLFSILKAVKNSNKKANKTTLNNAFVNNNFSSNKAQVVVADASFFGEQEAEYIKVYKRVVSLIKQALLSYNEDEDKYLLDKKIEKVKNEIMLKQTSAIRQLIETHAQKELNKNLMKLDRHANEIVVDIA